MVEIEVKASVNSIPDDFASQLKWLLLGFGTTVTCMTHFEKNTFLCFVFLFLYW